MVAFSLVLILAVGPPETLDPDRRETLDAYLGAIDRPIRPEAWRALGPGAEAALADVAASPQELPSRRARALEGLRALGGPRAEAMHLVSAKNERAPRLVRTTALRGLAVLLPADRLHAEVAPMLEDRDGAVRAAAAQALVHGAPTQGCADVRAAAAKEGSGARRYDRALARCPAPARSRDGR